MWPFCWLLGVRLLPSIDLHSPLSSSGIKMQMCMFWLILDRAARAGVLGTVWGFPNGLAYAVMLTWAARQVSPAPASAAALVDAFFARFAEFDWTRPVQLGHRSFVARPHEHISVAAPASGRS